MKKARILQSVTMGIFILFLAVPYAAMPQDAGSAPLQENTEQVFRPEELDQMVASIALYPDTLLAQVLTAATYPVDIVAADRFAKDHPGLNGQALVDAAKDKDWASSVKAMLQFPAVLAMMDNQLDWTTKLGDAFLAQQRDVMDSVQRLRQKAYAQGKLGNSKEQAVTVDPQTQIIIIEPANPDVVYVPVYDPEVEYGTWWYPDYPPYYCYYPGFVGGFFLGGFFVSLDYGWRAWDCDWHHHNVNILVNNFNRFVTHSFERPARFRVNGAGRASVSWQHNPQFRRGAAYRDYWTARHLGGQQVSGAAGGQNLPAVRGFEQNRASQSIPLTGAINLGTTRSSSPQVTRIESRAAVVKQPVARPSVTTQVSATRGHEDSTVFSGIGRGGSERAASFRGQSSIQSIRSSGGSSGLRSAGGVGRGGSEVSHGGGGSSRGSSEREGNHR